MSEQLIWNFLKKEGFNDYGIAGLMGNLNAESGLRSNNLQDTYSSRLGMSDVQYTIAVDNGTYTNFIRDSAGYGLAQWTYWTRKSNLLNYANQKNKSIGDLEMQLEFLCKELKEQYTNSVYNVLKTAKSVQEASDAVLMNFERPANAAAQKANRARMGQVYYDKFSKGVGIQMGVNRFKKRSNQRLSNFFTSNEFDCKGGGCCSETLIDSKLVEYLDQIRKHFNAPITITSAYRCPVHNGRVGGATGSRHTKGEAADFVVKGVTPREVARYAESIGIKGIGLYETNADGHFVHIDTRTAKSFWYGQRQEYRSTFGAPTIGGGSSQTQSSTLLALNSTGPAVKEVQQMLLKLGYVLTDSPTDKTLGADGIFGAKTRKAVADFQSKNGLDADGIVGKDTMAALKKAVSSSSGGRKGKVTASALYVRTAPGTDNPHVGLLRRGTVCDILEVKDGWGRVSNPNGWVSMEYIEDI